MLLTFMRWMDELVIRCTVSGCLNPKLSRILYLVSAWSKDEYTFSEEKTALRFIFSASSDNSGNLLVTIGGTQMRITPRSGIAF